MNRAALFALLLASCELVPAVELEGTTIVLTTAERATLATCAEQGGCVVVTRTSVMALVKRTIAITLDEVAKETTCGKGWI